MSIVFLHRLWRFVLLMLLQLVLLNHIHLFGYVMPLVLVYLTMNFSRGTSRIGLLLWGFACGLVYDVFSNTMGLAMTTCTLMAMLQPALLNLFTPREAPEDMVPSMKNMGVYRYSSYNFISLLLFHIAFYALDAFTLSNWQLTLLSIGGGTFMAFVIVELMQSLHPNANSENLT